MIASWRGGAERDGHTPVPKIGVISLGSPPNHLFFHFHWLCRVTLLLAWCYKLDKESKYLKFVHWVFFNCRWTK